VGDVDRRGAETLVQPRDFDAHVIAQFGVQIGERLVEQEHRRAFDHCAGDGDALLLAARKFGRATLQKSLDAQNGRDFVDAAINFGLGRLEPSEAEGDVVVHGHVRIERIVLEHHRDVAIARRKIVDHAAVDRNQAAADFLEVGDHAQNRRFSAPGRSNKDNECAVHDVKVDVVDAGNWTE
jgi:hypothetical protein